MFCYNTAIIGQDELHEETIVFDSRDGNSYKAIKIMSTLWLTESMRYKTKNAVIVEGTNLDLDISGYYYPYTESDEACPESFEIPKNSDWEKYLEYLLVLNDVPTSAVEHFSHDSKRVTGVAKSIHDDTFSFFEESNPLNIKVNGMVQGGQLVADGAFNFWTRMDNSTDKKYHLHIGKNEYGNHTHKHHILTKNEKKKRKFAVRCIKRNIANN